MNMNILKKAPGKAKTFPKSARDLAEKDPDAKIVIYERTGIRKRYLAELPIAEAAEVAGSIESVLASEYGGGTYEINIVSRDSEVKGRYSYDIAGAPKGRRSSQSSDEQQSKLKDRKSGSDEALVTVLGKLADAAIGQRTSSAEELERSLRLIKELKGEDGEYRQIVSQMFSGVMQKALNQQPFDIENVLQIIQLSKELGPTFHQDDSLSSLLGLVTPMLYGALSGKSPAGQPQLTQEQIQALQPYINQLQSAATQALPPGQSQAQISIASPEPPRQTPQAAAKPTEPKSSSEEDQIRFYRMFLEKFRKRIAEGASDLELAKKIIVMLEYSVDFMKENPHPWVLGMVANMRNPVTFAAELQKFFERIPELSGNHERQEAIRKSMVLLYTGQAPDNDTEDADMVTDDLDNDIGQPAETGAEVDG